MLSKNLVGERRPRLQEGQLKSFYELLPEELQVSVLRQLDADSVCNLYKAHFYHGRLVNIKPVFKLAFKHKVLAQNVWPSLHFESSWLRKPGFFEDVCAAADSYQFINISSHVNNFPPVVELLGGNMKNCQVSLIIDMSEETRFPGICGHFPTIA